MGRIKTSSIKVIGNDILRQYFDKFTDNFEENKRILMSIKRVESKKIRNIIAGYITKEVKRLKGKG